MCIEQMLLKQLRMKRKIKQWCSTIVSYQYTEQPYINASHLATKRWGILNNLLAYALLLHGRLCQSC
jgi:hypothetical protein